MIHRAQQNAVREQTLSDIACASLHSAGNTLPISIDSIDSTATRYNTRFAPPLVTSTSYYSSPFLLLLLLRVPMIAASSGMSNGPAVPVAASIRAAAGGSASTVLKLEALRPGVKAGGMLLTLPPEPELDLELGLEVEVDSELVLSVGDNDDDDDDGSSAVRLGAMGGMVSPALCWRLWRTRVSSSR